MNLDDTTRQRIEEHVRKADVTLFMKGTRDAPQCGFSATVVRILDTLVPDYHTVDVLADAGIRDGIKTYSSWPTIPQLYVKGEFIGGCDIVQELYDSGELHGKVGVELSDGPPPAIEVTPAAAAALAAAIEQQATGGQELHLHVDARFQNALSLSPRLDSDLAVESNGVTLLLDRASATRADGITIDVADTPRGPGFKIENPRAPQVHPMTVQDLARRLEAGESLELVDVRTPGERERASIPGSLLLDADSGPRLEALPKDTVLAFYCHTGGRSQQAAEHFAGLGFTAVHNVVGGIEAWSNEIDSSVPRY